jgi:hypothetical protein
VLATTFFEEHFIWVAHPRQEHIALRDATHGDAIFVSGKLMDSEFIRTVTGRYVPFTAAVARNYKRGERVRKRKRTLLLEAGRGSIVLGVLLLKLTQADNDALDRFEQVPDIRRRVSIPVTVGAYERTATTFLLND